MASIPKKQRTLFADTPREINVTEFAKERANEICDLLAVVENHALPPGEVSHGPRTFIQRLPRHLRRRAMSYNVKRLPRKDRGFLDPLITDITTHRKKPPSRFHRRRPANLLQAYARRQRRKCWLETHIWHAKRFRMVDYWGYRVAERSCARGFRPAYRDVKSHCLVQDMSYLCCIQLEGPREFILDRLSLCCSQSVGLTFRFIAAQKGGQEVSTVLYRPNQYPYGCVGPAKFFWKRTDEDPKTIWIWVHPAIHGEVLDIFRILFDFQLLQQISTAQELSAEKPETLKDVQLAKYATAHAGGLRESKSVAFESGLFSFPNDWPDTNSGNEDLVTEEKSLIDAYNRKPPNRRVHFQEMGIKYPFKYESFAWTELIQGWQSELGLNWSNVTGSSDGIQEQFFVLRDKASLRKIGAWLNGCKNHGIIDDFLKKNACALVPVRIESAGKGHPSRRSLICLPEQKDVGIWGSKRETIMEKKAGVSADVEEKMEECNWPDSDFVALRKETEVDLNELFTDKDAEKELARKEKLKEKKKKRKKKIPNTESDKDKKVITENVVWSCCRKVIGFVGRGDTSLAVGRGVGLGYCSLLGLKELSESVSRDKQMRNKVLFRNVMSRAYRVAMVEILMN